MLILVLIGVYLVFKVTTSCEKLHQDNGRSTERYVILWDVVKLYKILEIEVISTQRDNFSATKISRKAHFSRVTEVVECCQMCWNLHQMQHICNRYATKIMICIGHFQSNLGMSFSC